MGQFSVGRCDVIVFAKKFFLAGFLERKNLDFEFFSKQIRHFPKPTAFFTFDAHVLQTYLQNLFVFYFFALKTSYGNGVDFFGS